MSPETRFDRWEALVARRLVPARRLLPVPLLVGLVSLLAASAFASTPGADVQMAWNFGECSTG
jgi:hypothetical protein